MKKYIIALVTTCGFNIALAVPLEAACPSAEKITYTDWKLMINAMHAGEYYGSENVIIDGKSYEVVNVPMHAQSNPKLKLNRANSTSDKCVYEVLTEKGEVIPHEEIIIKPTNH